MYYEAIDYWNSPDLYFEHYGVKGMKWGVRRYVNNDGTLTPEGKKRYYTTDNFGRDSLTKRGYKYNNKRLKKADRYANLVKTNAEFANREKIDKYRKEYSDAHKKNNEFYLSEQKKWFSNTGDYKGKDYYQFKYITKEKWLKSEDSKREEKAHNNLRKIYNQAAKETTLYSKTFDQLNSTSLSSLYNKPLSIKKVQYGQYAVDKIMRQIEVEEIHKEKKI